MFQSMLKFSELNQFIHYVKFRARRARLVDRFAVSTGTAGVHGSCLISPLKNNSKCKKLWVGWKKESRSSLQENIIIQLL